MDVEWLKALNKSRQNKALMELEESVLEKAISHIENKVIFSFPQRFPLFDLLLVSSFDENDFFFHTCITKSGNLTFGLIFQLCQ